MSEAWFPVNLNPFAHMCQAGTTVASWSFTLEVVGLNPFTAMTNSLVTKFSDSIRGKLKCSFLFPANKLYIIILST